MLSPYRVLDLTTERGLLCGQILGDLGADVIQIEPPGGSPARHLAPFFHDVPHPDRSLYWWAFNRNKRSITLNLEHADGQAIVQRLAKISHFVIESDNPGILAQRGCGYQDLAKINPALVYVSITPFGQDGPKVGYADSDLVILAAGGPLVLTGDEDRAPVRVSVPQAYLHASGQAAAAALIAHHERRRSGLGQHVDVSAQQAVAQATQSGLLAGPLGERDFQRLAGGAKMGPVNVRLVWPAKDGYVSIGFLFGSAIGHFTKRLMQWVWEEGFCDEATRDKDWVAFGAIFLGDPEALKEYDRLVGIVERFSASKTKDELLQEALKRALLIAPVQTTAEVLESKQLAAREYWQDLEHPELGQTVKYPGPFAKFSAAPLRYRRRPPTTGEHNREIYCGELGFTEQQVADLLHSGVI
ncbi:MAG: CoA transferase [Deltaproteobacteria bacterium]|nr:CoA transferase [Deltaproteobacteria bacterium]